MPAATIASSYLSNLPDSFIGHKRQYHSLFDSASTTANKYSSSFSSNSPSAYCSTLTNYLPPLTNTMFNFRSSHSSSPPMPIEPPISTTSSSKRRRLDGNGYNNYSMGGASMFPSYPSPQYPHPMSAPLPPPPMMHNNSQPYPYAPPPPPPPSQHNSAYGYSNNYPQNSYPYNQSYPMQYPQMGYQPPMHGQKPKKLSSSSKSSAKVIERRYRCTQPGCGNMYRSMEQLQKHQSKSHTKPRPYHCDKCPRSFAERGNLKKHAKSVHNGEKDKVCPYPGCGKKFSFNDGLSRHVRNVHQQLRPYACPCGKSFKQLSHLKKHANSRICSGGR
eukprot:Plantae.Rhodophyta-Hildenbrandia_rubra.ctg6018.p1 GENE.Plantae.Rhodophyta-Hildenbrandia_rubra.ctg6018~~Plantae.Rhodophyta-Hildenbrandia_rubra.ctg6018.p1  ORF type:complete len:347 (-),score=20.80 Plantae.Rhodophyta-Hildenbrandia_rubra.ctg6018:600-1589(-)